MKPLDLSFDDIYVPQILLTTRDFLLAYKPPKMHSAPGKGSSLAEWCAEKTSGLQRLSQTEYGLIHRLDYETHGILLFAQNEKAYTTLLADQRQGEIVKYYRAFVLKGRAKKAGFPLFDEGFLPLDPRHPKTIASPFRPYGPGSREVRPLGPSSPVTGKAYVTEILAAGPANQAGLMCVKARLCQGFRHQIRCHLAWAGFPILNDPLYGEDEPEKGILALRAEGIELRDPGSGKKILYMLSALMPKDIQDVRNHAGSSDPFL